LWWISANSSPDVYGLKLPTSPVMPGTLEVTAQGKSRFPCVGEPFKFG